jgi:hypothetical protein
MHAVFWLGNMMERDHLENTVVNGKIITMDLPGK